MRRTCSYDGDGLARSYKYYVTNTQIGATDRTYNHVGSPRVF